MNAELARVAGPVASLGLALLLAAPRRELRLAGLAAWALGGAALLAYLVPLGGEAAKVAAASVLALPLAWLLHRLPWALAFLTLALVPVRVPLRIGGEEAKLLLPLYAVVGSYALALAWQLVRGDPRARELGRLALPAAALVAWLGVSLAWSEDVRTGAVFLAAFVLPFGLLALGFARLPWSGRALTWLYRALVAAALVFAGIGLWQWWTRDVFWNPRVDVGNAYAPFFRVNSVFWDPSIYGRFLVVAILATIVYVLLGGRGPALLAAIGAALGMWAGLLFSFSQSSFAALIVGIVGASAIVWRRRALAALALVAAVTVTVGFSTPQIRDTLVTKSRVGWNRATSGRADLIAKGLGIAADHPVAGVGAGAFKRAYAERTGLKGRDPKKAASHNTFVTVAAETGVPGVLLLGWLVAEALLASLRRPSRSLAARAAIAAGLTLAAIVVHSFFYNALFEDPTAWALLGLVAVARRERDA